MKTGFQILPLLLVALGHPAIASRVQRRNGESLGKNAVQETRHLAPGVVPAEWFKNHWQSVWSKGCNSDHDKAMIETLSGVAKIRYENVMKADKTGKYEDGSCLWTLTMPAALHKDETFSVKFPKDDQKTMEQKIDSFMVSAYHYPAFSWDWAKALQVQWSWPGLSFWSSKKTIEQVIRDLQKETEKQNSRVELWVTFLSGKGEKKQFGTVKEAIKFLKDEIHNKGRTFQHEVTVKAENNLAYFANKNKGNANAEKVNAKEVVDRLFDTTMGDVENNFHMFALSDAAGDCWKIDHHSCIVGHKSAEGLYAGMLGNPGNIHNITSALHE